ncbi:MAG: hypothetical protein R3213_09525 [Flavobacteriaceae bacterium]|nr:hypothetical protein [Flavobacteriaceae bacterium]
MKRNFIALIAIILISHQMRGQNNESKEYTNFPIILTLQFHSLSMPFKNLKSNFKNIGIGVGTEVSYNGEQNWVHQVNLVWYRNKNVGNGLFFYTQAVWRPTVFNDFYTEAKLGVGYMIAYRPTESFEQKNGEWLSVGKKGKGLFSIPMGVSVGYSNFSETFSYSPFASYQFILLKDYNTSLPLVPQTLIQLGSRFHFNN